MVMRTAIIVSLVAVRRLSFSFDQSDGNQVSLPLLLSSLGYALLDHEDSVSHCVERKKGTATVLSAAQRKLSTRNFRLGRFHEGIVEFEMIKEP